MVTENTDQVYDEDAESVLTYQLIMLLSSFDILKVKILLVLAHVYPKEVTGAKLTRLIGYSRQANSIYRGVLPELETNRLILIKRPSKKLYNIAINHDNPLMFHLIQLAARHGEKLSRKLLLTLKN